MRRFGGRTGALLFVDRVFLQILEGSAEAVAALEQHPERVPGVLKGIVRSLAR